MLTAQELKRDRAKSILGTLPPYLLEAWDELHSLARSANDGETNCVSLDCLRVGRKYDYRIKRGYREDGMNLTRQGKKFVECFELLRFGVHCYGSTVTISW